MVRKPIEVKINVKGFAKFNRQMEAGIKRGLTKASLIVERKAKINSPFDTHTMQRSIKSEKVDKTIDGYSVTISPSVHYAAAVEFGKGKPRKGGKIPFMRPALKESEGQIRNAILGELRRIK